MAWLRRVAQHLTFNDPQRRVLAVLLLLLLAWTTFVYLRNPRTIPAPQLPLGERANELADRIDVNTADWSALASLPSIGEKRARDIVAYRQRVRERDPNAVPFRRPQDLLKVDGIGYTMMERLSAYLIFPETPATAPASTRTCGTPATSSPGSATRILPRPAAPPRRRRASST